MKSRDLFCASHASTAICSSMDQRKIVRPKCRSSPAAAAPCSSQLPFDPTSYIRKASPFSSSSPKQNLNAADVSHVGHSSRHLLTDSHFLDNILSDCDKNNNPQALVPYHPPETSSSKLQRQRSSKETTAVIIPTPPPQTPRVVCNRSDNESNIVKSSAASSSTPSHAHINHQVVELRVAIHCKGCEGKVRKHLSKMEGVTSFSIDLDSKKVTVIGNVTPLGVLANISKVKNAQFWPSPATSSSSSPRVSLPIR